jgi:hypothetical protein
MSQIKNKWIGNDQVDANKVLLDNNTALRSKKQDGSEIELLKIDGSDVIHIPYAPILAARGTAPEAIATVGQISDAVGGIDFSAINGKISALENYHPQQVLYVAKNGNDSTGVGSFQKPFLTIEAANAAITDAANNKRYVIVIAPGTYVESATFSFKANVSYVGTASRNSTIVTKVSGELSFDLFVGGSRITLCNLAVFNSGGGAMTSLRAVNTGATQLTQLDIHHCLIGFNIQVESVNTQFITCNWKMSTFANITTKGGVVINAQGIQYGDSYTHGDATQAAAGTYQGTAYLLQSSQIGNPAVAVTTINGADYLHFASYVEKVNYDIKAVNVVTNGVVLIYDATMKPFNSLNVGSVGVNGATVLLERISQAQNVGYIPADNSKWVLVPSETKSALDELVSRVKATENLASSYAKNDLSNLVANASGYLMASKINMQSNPIENLGNGVNANDAVNKGQMDAADGLKANTNLGNLVGPTAINAALLPDAPISRSIGGLGSAWGSVFATRYGAPTATIDVGLVNGASGQNQVTMTSTAGISSIGIHFLVVPSLNINISINSIVNGTTVGLAAVLPSTLTNVQAYVVSAVSVRSENETGDKASGHAFIRSGATVTGKSGNMVVQTGASSSGGATGDILLTVGSTSGVRGKVTLDGSEINVSGKQIKSLASGTTSDAAVNKGQLDAVAAAVGAVAAGVKWRDPAHIITADPELRTAVEGDTLSSVLPMGDDDLPVITEAEIPVDSFIISENGASSKLWKVYDDAGIKKITALGFNPMAGGDSFIVELDLLDAPSAQENQAIYNFNGAGMVKLGDIDWSLANGIDLSPAYVMAAINEAVLAGDSVEVAISKLDKKISDLAARVTVNEGNISAINGEIVDINQAITDEIARATGEENTLVKLDGSRAMTGALNLNSHKITNLTDGSVASDAINKGQLDSAISGVNDTITALDGRVGAAEGDITALNTRVGTLEAAALAYKKEKFVLSSTDITNQYIDMSFLVEADSMVAFVDRVAIHEGASDDYALSVSGSVSRLSFLNDIATGGVSALTAGDTIYVTYAYKPEA